MFSILEIHREKKKSEKHDLFPGRIENYLIPYYIKEFNKLKECGEITFKEIIHDKVIHSLIKLNQVNNGKK